MPKSPEGYQPSREEQVQEDKLSIGQTDEMLKVINNLSHHINEDKIKEALSPFLGNEKKAIIHALERLRTDGYSGLEPIKTRDFFVENGIVEDIWFPDVYIKRHKQEGMEALLKYYVTFCREKMPSDLRSLSWVRSEIEETFPGRLSGRRSSSDAKGHLQYFADDIIDLVYNGELKLDSVKDDLIKVIPFTKPVRAQDELKELVETGKTKSMEEYIIQQRRERMEEEKKYFGGYHP